MQLYLLGGGDAASMRQAAQIVVQGGEINEKKGTGTFGASPPAARVIDQAAMISCFSGKAI